VSYNDESGRTHDYFEGYLGAYMDGELDLVRGLEIEEHLKECAQCSRDLRNQQALRKAMRTDPPYFAAPSNLRSNVLSSIRKADPVKAKPAKQSWQWLGLAASFAVLAVVAFLVVPLIRHSPEDEQLTRDVIAEHVRSLMRQDTIIQVESSNQHVVKPWFNGKIDFSPPVKDLQEKDFPLIGGRLDFMDNQRVAVLVYKRQQHIITVFIWPSNHNGQSVTSQNGYNVVHWSKDGMTFWAVSDLNSAELQQFSQLFQQ